MRKAMVFGLKRTAVSSYETKQKALKQQAIDDAAALDNQLARMRREALLRRGIKPEALKLVPEKKGQSDGE